jgi:Predicted transcriptional regulators
MKQGYLELAPGAEVRLREARKARGLAQTVVADAINVSQATIARYERGQIAIPPAMVASLAEAVGCSEGWLATGEGDSGDSVASTTAFLRDQGALSARSGQIANAGSPIERLCEIVSSSVGFRVTEEQALEWVIRKAGVGDEVYGKP